MLELQPDIAWDKGKAVLWLLDKLIIPVAEEAISTPTTSRTVATDTNKPKEGVTETPTHIAAAPGTNGAGAGVENMSSAAVDDSGRADEEGGFFTIFIGDDKTDEVRGSRGGKGVGGGGWGVIFRATATAETVASGSPTAVTFIIMHTVNLLGGGHSNTALSPACSSKLNKTEGSMSFRKQHIYV